MNNKKALMIAPRFPLPLKSGAQLRIYNTLRELSKSYDVTLVSLIQNGEGKNHINEIEELGVEVQPIPHTCSKKDGLIKFLSSRKPYRVAKFQNEELETQTAKIIESNDFDFSWVHFLTTLPLIQSRLPSPLILDQHNADVKYWETFREGSLPEQIFAVLNQRRLKRLQQERVSELDAILPVSEKDAKATQEWSQNTPLWVTPNGVDLSKYDPSTTDRNGPLEVIFVGSLDRPRNEEAVKWFVNNAWEKIYECNSNVEFKIIGRNPTQKVIRLDSQAGVNVIGEVPDVVPHYDAADLVVAPFILGGGTKLKVLETLAMKKALVTTPKGAAGIDITDGKEAVIRDRDKSFAEAINKLLSSPETRESLGENGRELVQERYTWEAIMSETMNRVEKNLLS